MTLLEGHRKPVLEILSQNCQKAHPQFRLKILQCLPPHQHHDKMKLSSRESCDMSFSRRQKKVTMRNIKSHKKKHWNTKSTNPQHNSSFVLRKGIQKRSASNSIFISTEGALRILMNYDNHPSNQPNPISTYNTYIHMYNIHTYIHTYYIYSIEEDLA